ncbi:Do family serine endopeptidase [Dysgonomonas sp. 520]|uniref:Do family serine endopeptidase n=1 Tax=Dysgonomonas sp. 520 TaxID=2302931 RepID=UPI0013CFA62D|nr:Do family serine endopeptidase [Dysgonomonas sp. 520]NDW09265.1 Do family serine endopeptidase [Dysgonomonas sp. 520]
MKKNWKKISTYVIVALVGAGATFGAYNLYNNHSSGEIADYYDYGKDFQQDQNIHLASLTAEGYPDFTKAAENSVHAVVHIKSVVKSSGSSGRSRGGTGDPFFDYFFGFGDKGGSSPYESQPSVGMGSGVIISKDGYIITNNHVIDKANDIEVTLNDNRKFTAKLVGTDPKTDIALLKIEGDNFPTIPFGDSDKLKVGEWVLAIGNPFNLNSTVTAGIVSAKSRGGIGSGDIQSFIQTDAAINRGNSGGALVNTAGQLIGINTAIYSQTGDFAGYGFAVPVSIAGKVVADIKEYGTVQRAILGVIITDVSVAKESDADEAKNLKATEGAYVNDFAERSPAKEAGLEKGDVIVGVNDSKIKSVSELLDQINRFRPGDKVKITFMRGSTTKTTEIVLKNSAGDTKIVKSTDGIAAVGAAFKTLSEEKKKQYGIRSGVEVAGVDNSGKFKKEGITKGFIITKINNQNVSTSEDVESIIKKVAVSDDKVLFITGFYPSGSRKYFAIDLSE